MVGRSVGRWLLVGRSVSYSHNVVRQFYLQALLAVWDLDRYTFTQAGQLGEELGILRCA